MKRQQSKPKLISVVVKDKDTDTIILIFPPTRAGERKAEKYRGLSGLEIIKQYE